MKIRQSVLDIMLEDLNRNFAIMKDASIEYVFRKHSIEYVKESLLRLSLLQIQLLPLSNSFIVTGNWEESVFTYEEESHIKELNKLATLLSILTVAEIKEDYERMIKEKIDDMATKGLYVEKIQDIDLYRFKDEFTHLFDLIPPPEIYKRIEA